MKNKAIKVSALLCTLMLIVVGLSILFGNQRNDENYIEKAISYYEPQGAEVVLIKNGEIDKVLNYGYANVKEKTEVSDDTQFKIASISKVFTSYAIMKLVDAGKLDLDVPVNTYLTQWQVPDSEYDASKVTLRTLLCHTSGLSGSDFLGYTGAEIGVAATLKKDNVHLLREPGTQFAYLEATGLGICQLVIEETTGMSFSDYMQITVFNKLGMNKTSFDDNASSLAIPYAGLNQPVSVTHYALTGASGITSTGKDMTKFAAELMRYQQSGAEMFVPQQLADGAWCLGIAPKTLDSGKMVYEHNGTLTGWNAQLVIDPATQDGLIVLANSDKAYYMTYQLMEDWGRYILGKPIVDDNVAPMVQMVKTILLILDAFLILMVVWNYMRMKSERIVKKEVKKGRVTRSIVGSLMFIMLGCYIVIFYTPVVFYLLYQMPDYYLFTFFPPIIHWLLFEIIVFSAILIWRCGYRRNKKKVLLN